MISIGPPARTAIAIRAELLGKSARLMPICDEKSELEVRNSMLFRIRTSKSCSGTSLGLSIYSIALNHSFQ